MQCHYGFNGEDAGGDTSPGALGATPANRGEDPYIARKSQSRCSTGGSRNGCAIAIGIDEPGDEGAHHCRAYSGAEPSRHTDSKHGNSGRIARAWRKWCADCERAPPSISCPLSPRLPVPSSVRSRTSAGTLPVQG